MFCFYAFFVFFFFNDTATTEIYTLSLHDALPISGPRHDVCEPARAARRADVNRDHARDSNRKDRKSTRLNSSHLVISYAVFCLKKKKKKKIIQTQAKRTASSNQQQRSSATYPVRD